MDAAAAGGVDDRVVFVDDDDDDGGDGGGGALFVDDDADPEFVFVDAAEDAAAAAAAASASGAADEDWDMPPSAWLASLSPPRPALAVPLSKAALWVRPTSAEWESVDPTPDARLLFLAFNEAFFFGKLLAVEVSWSRKMTRDTVNTLLHEMIHALLFVTHSNTDRDGHGASFCGEMRRVNAAAGSSVTVYHTFHDEVQSYQVHVWKCNGPCQHRPPRYGILRRAMNRPPQPADWWWADHLRNCGGTYVKIAGPDPKGSSAGGGHRPASPERGQRKLPWLTATPGSLARSGSGGGESSGGGGAVTAPPSSHVPPADAKAAKRRRVDGESRGSEGAVVSSAVVGSGGGGGGAGAPAADEDSSAARAAWIRRYRSAGAADAASSSEVAAASAGAGAANGGEVAGGAGASAASSVAAAAAALPASSGEFASGASTGSGSGLRRRQDRLPSPSPSPPAPATAAAACAPSASASDVIILDD